MPVNLLRLLLMFCVVSGTAGSAFGQSTTKPDAATHWRHYRQGPFRRGQVAVQLPRAKPKTKWQYRFKRALRGAPVVDATGRVYAASIDGTVARFDRDGRVMWKRQLSGAVFSPLSLGPGGLYVGTDADRLHVLSPDTGKDVHVYKLGDCKPGRGLGPERVRCDVDTAPLFERDGSVVIAADALYRFDGKRKAAMHVSFRGHTASSVAAFAGGYLLGSQTEHALLAYDRAGTQLWKFSTRYHFDPTPAVFKNIAYIGCDDRRFYAVNTNDGKLLWEFVTRGRVRGGAAVDQAGTAYFGSYDRYIYAVTSGGALRWKYRTQGSVHAPPVLDAAGVVLVGSRDGFLYAIDGLGQLRWRISVLGAVDSAAAVGDDGTIYVGTRRGLLYALR